MITAAQVNELRKLTGAGMMDCKKALVESEGNMEEAIVVLRKKGAAKASSKSERETSEGSAFIFSEGNKAAIVLISCETDFVARNDKFIALGEELAKKAIQSDKDSTLSDGNTQATELAGVIGENIKVLDIQIIEAGTIGKYIHSNKKIGVLVALEGGNKEIATDIAMHVAAMNPKVLSPNEISEELVNKEKEIWIDQLKNEGKPENIIENILKGKEKKFREESALNKQAFVKDNKKTIEEFAKENGATVVSFIRLSI